MEIAVEFFMEIRYNNLVLAADTFFPQTWRKEMYGDGSRLCMEMERE